MTSHAQVRVESPNEGMEQSALASPGGAHDCQGPAWLSVAMDILQDLPGPSALQSRPDAQVRPGNGRHVFSVNYFWHTHSLSLSLWANFVVKMSGKRYQFSHTHVVYNYVIFHASFQD